jgi:hypothetical protein
LIYDFGFVRELRANCDNAANTLTLDHSGSTTTMTYTGGSRSIADQTFDQILINMGTSANTVNVRSTVMPVSVTGRGGRDNVFINANVGGIQAHVDVSNSDYTALTVDTSAFAGTYPGLRTRFWEAGGHVLRSILVGEKGRLG